MKYVTGKHALNLLCSLDTYGDWHFSSLRWENIEFAESDNSIYGTYGIDPPIKLPNDKGTHPIANHIRACLDMILECKFPVIQGMRKELISNEKYTPEILDKVYMLQTHERWSDIDKFMRKEYRVDWLRFLKKKEFE